MVNMGISCEPLGNRKQPGQVVYYQSGRKCPRNVDDLKRWIRSEVEDLEAVMARMWRVSQLDVG